MLDASGVLITGTKTSYWPYGGIRSGGTTLTDKLFTGQQQEPGDAALKLSYYHARFYSAELGHFVSADTSVASGLNRFAYAGNAPTQYNDPTGFVGGCGLFDPCRDSTAARGYRENQERLVRYLTESRGWIFLPPDFIAFYRGEAASQNALYFVPKLDKTLVGLMLAAGTYAIAIDAWHASQVNIDDAVRHGVVTVNAGVKAFNSEGDSFDFLEAATALLALSNGYPHYTSPENAAKILNPGGGGTPFLKAGAESNGKVFLTKAPFLSASEAERKLGIDDARVVIGLYALSPITGVGLAKNRDGTLIEGDPVEFTGDSPFGIQPIFQAYLLP